MERHELETFLTLAEELHFARTADRLHVSPGRVSQIIKTIERRIGARLFERNSRHVALTAAGEQLRDGLAPHYDGIQQVVAEVSAAARSTQWTLAIGFVWAMTEELMAICEKFRERNPACRLTFREAALGDPLRGLRDGEIDLLYFWDSESGTGMSAGPVLVTVPKVLAVSSMHPYAQRDAVSLEDLAECYVIPIADAADSRWEESAVPSRTPSGRRIPRGAPVASILELFAGVGADHGVAVVGADAPKYHNRDGITFVPIRDAQPTEWTLLWRTAGETALLREFVETATKVAGSIEPKSGR